MLSSLGVQRFYEPWQPKVGDRVRIHISPECRFPEIPHSVIDGAIGTVINLFKQAEIMITTNGQWHLRGPADESEAAHRVVVKTDPGIYYDFDIGTGKQPYTLMCLVAVLEIEPLITIKP